MATNGSRRDHEDIEMPCTLTVSLSISTVKLLKTRSLVFQDITTRKTRKEYTGTLFTIFKN